MIKKKGEEKQKKKKKKKRNNNWNLLYILLKDRRISIKNKVYHLCALATLFFPYLFWLTIECFSYVIYEKWLLLNIFTKIFFWKKSVFSRTQKSKWI